MTVAVVNDKYLLTTFPSLLWVKLPTGWLLCYFPVVDKGVVLAAVCPHKGGAGTHSYVYVGDRHDAVIHGVKMIQPGVEVEERFFIEENAPVEWVTLRQQSRWFVDAALYIYIYIYASAQ